MENDIPTKRKMKASRSIYSYIWQRRLQAKINQKRKRSLLHIGKGNNLLSRYNGYKYIHTKCPGTHFIKQTLLDIRRQIDQNTIIMFDFTTHSQQCLRHLNNNKKKSAKNHQN
jgi:hypothetical protein